jgi:hypothetical protein
VNDSITGVVVSDVIPYSTLSVRYRRQLRIRLTLLPWQAKICQDDISIRHFNSCYYQFSIGHGQRLVFNG